MKRRRLTLADERRARERPLETLGYALELARAASVHVPDTVDGKPTLHIYAAVREAQEAFVTISSEVAAAYPLVRRGQGAHTPSPTDANEDA